MRVSAVGHLPFALLAPSRLRNVKGSKEDRSEKGRQEVSVKRDRVCELMWPSSHRRGQGPQTPRSLLPLAGIVCTDEAPFGAVWAQPARGPSVVRPVMLPSVSMVSSVPPRGDPGCRMQRGKPMMYSQSIEGRGFGGRGFRSAVSGRVRTDTELQSLRVSCICEMDHLSLVPR